MKTKIAAVIAIALAIGLAWELRDFCAYHPQTPQSVHNEYGFPGTPYDHSRHIECGVNLPHIWLGGAK